MASRAEQRQGQDVVVVCLPGGGGPQFVEAVRRTIGPRPGKVRLIVLAESTARTLMASSNPLGLGGWIPGDELLQSQTDNAHREACRLAWLLWEMYIPSEAAVILTEDVATVTCRLIADPEIGAVLVAASSYPRWRSSLKAISRYAQASRRLHIAVDTPTTTLQRWAAQSGF